MENEINQSQEVTSQEEFVDIDRELVVKETQTLEDGKHIGVITKVTYRDLPYQYVDLWIKPDDKDMEVKVSFPQNITPTSSLGELLTRFGEELVKDKRINLYKFFTGRKVEFVTITEPVKTVNGMREYSKIVKESLKPYESS